VVDDITQEEDVELVMDVHRDPQFDEVPACVYAHDVSVAVYLGSLGIMLL
jgi:hypothetical protein